MKPNSFSCLDHCHVFSLNTHRTGIPPFLYSKINADYVKELLISFPYPVWNQHKIQQDKGGDYFCTLCNMVLKLLARVKTEEEEVKMIQVWKEKVKVSLFVEIRFYVWEQKLHQKILRFDEQCQQNGRTQRKISSLQYTNNKHTKKEPTDMFHSL